MKKAIYNSVVLIVAFVMMSANIYAIEKDRVIKKSYKVDDDTELKIKNSFGRVDVESYNGDEIFIEVRIWAKGSSEKNVNEFINSIDIDFNKRSDEISVKTSNISNNGKVKEFEVNYTIKIPTGNELSIDNSFGDVNIAKHSGKVDLEISHGNFKVGTILNSENEIELKFGNGKIEKFGSGKIELSHSNLDIESILELNLESKFSNTKIKNVSNIIYAEVSHGSLKAKSINANFKEVKIKAEFSKLSLGFEEKSAYNIEYKGSFSSFSKPSDFVVVEKENDYTSESIKAKVNNGGEAVQIKISHSSLSID